MNGLTKNNTFRVASAIFGAGAIVGIPLTYYLVTTDHQPIASPQVTDPAPIVAPEHIEPESEPEVVPEPMEPEPEPIVVPEPIEPELEPVSLRADSRNVNVGSVTGGLLNPLRSVYDVGEPGSEGVDVDRSTLRITEVVSGTFNGVVEIVDDGKNLLYTPDFELTQGMSGVDEVKYEVVSDSEGVVKSVEGIINIDLESEHVGDNRSKFSGLMRNNFSSAVDSAIRNNFRFSDDVISNDDLRLVKYFVDNEFSEASIDVIMRIPEDLSPVRNVDDHSLRKLLAVEKGLYQNLAFVDSYHGINSWPEDYFGVMKRASFVIPSLIEVIEGNKTINYDKLHLDEVFEKLGGEYTGLFSRGQNYVPFYGHLHPSDIAPPTDGRIANPNNLDAVLTPEEVQGNKDRNVPFPVERGAWGFTENGLRYYDAFYNPLTVFNENVINFSVLAMLDEFNFTLGKPLVDKSSDEINYLFDLLDKTHGKTGRLFNPLFFGDGTTGGYGVVYGWENGFMSNGERTNVYSQVRSIIGSDVNSVSDGVFGLMNWLKDTKKHATSRPYLPNITFTERQEVEILNSLQSSVFYPGVYHFIPREYGGVWFGGSRSYPGIMTGALRSLNVQSRQFYTDDGYFGSGVRVPPNNLGSIVIDGETWLYNGNFAFGTAKFTLESNRTIMKNACQTLFPEENFTLEKFIEVKNSNSRIRENFFYGNTETCDEYNLPLTR